MPRNFEDQYSFRPYIHHVIGYAAPGKDITGSALNELNLIVHFIAEQLVNRASQLVLSRHEKTIRSPDIQASVNLVFPEDLAKYAVNEGTKFTARYNASSADNIKNELGKRAKPIRRSVKASLLFPVSRVENIMRIHMKNTLLGHLAPIYLTAVLEYIVAEILELAGSIATDKKVKRINNSHLIQAIHNDYELNLLLKDVTLSSGVVY